MAAGLRAAARPGGRRARRAAARPMSEINVTPFVDVMLVLLIIFMVAAPLLVVGVPLELPETEASSLPTPEDEPLTVNLDGQGRIFIQDVEVGLDSLVPRLRAIRGERGEGPIFLRADRRLDYGRVMVVMGALSGAGFREIALVTEQAEPGAGAAADTE